MKNTMTWLIAVFTTAFLSMLMMQLYLYGDAIEEARHSALNTWYESDPNNMGPILRYFANCTRRDTVTTTAKPVPAGPLSINACAAKHGSAELASVILIAADKVPVPTPLRWFL